MIVVSNTTPLIGLAIIQRFDLLEKLFEKVLIPQAVYSEAVVKGYEVGGAKREVSAATWIRTVAVHDRLAVEELLKELDLGEAEVIVLARELQADLVLMDERKGRRKLAQLGIPMVGTVGILLRAKKAGLLEAIRPDIENLRAQDFSISQRIMDLALREANE